MMETKFECIIFVGIQGSGKSTFYKENFFKTHAENEKQRENTYRGLF